MAESEEFNLTTLTVDLLSAYVTNNSVPSADLATLIRATHTALAEINAPAAAESASVEVQPAVSVRKSLGSREHILSLIDGKPYKTLKRHLAGHGLTPAEYRQRYNLPSSYPMVAPAYSEQRRIVAQKLGLGRKRPAAKAAAQPTAITTPAKDVAKASKPRGRPKAAAATKATTPKAPKAKVSAAAPKAKAPAAAPKAAAKPATAKTPGAAAKKGAGRRKLSVKVAEPTT